MPAIVQIILVLFLALVVLVALTKRFPVHLSPKQAKTMSYVAMGGVVVAILAGLFRTL
ncbi:MAG: hypothetical protein LAT62_11720 [Natronospirillum sp.]|uniref:hypothetical protein n=1 Tax=Natronospirillum sp. TaxID=2812955 RepID=UPI0025DC55B1|nr:hypothetical protein [Natronospirillum sp.]MCH8552599.1 hypothetical protein [Natronospirillum sp.]